MRLFCKTALLIMVACAPLRAVNILPNSSFEYWLLGMPAGWLTSEPIVEGSAIADTSARTGDYCVRLRASDTVAFLTGTTIVRPGFHYEFSGWTRVPGLLGGSFVLQFLKLDLSAIGSPTMLLAMRSPNYREYVRWLTAPDSAALLSVSFVTIPGATVYADDFTLNDSTLLGIEEEPVLPLVPIRPVRKIVATPAAIASLGTDAVIYDPTGRQIADRSRMRPFGVYFVIQH